MNNLLLSDIEQTLKKNFQFSPYYYAEIVLVKSTFMINDIKLKCNAIENVLNYMPIHQLKKLKNLKLIPIDLIDENSILDSVYDYYDRPLYLDLITTQRPNTDLVIHDIMNFLKNYLKIMTYSEEPISLDESATDKSSSKSIHSFQDHQNMISIKKLNDNKNASYKLKSNGSIDVFGDVFINDKNLTKIPVKFGKVVGNFCCQNNELINLENCPIEVTKNFRCYHNKIQSLSFSPIKIGQDFDVSHNEIEYLKGCPSYIGGTLDITNNSIYKISSSELPKNLSGIRYKGNLLDNEVKNLFDRYMAGGLTWEKVLNKIDILSSKNLTNLNSKTGIFD